MKNLLAVSIGQVAPFLTWLSSILHREKNRILFFAFWATRKNWILTKVVYKRQGTYGAVYGGMTLKVSVLVGLVGFLILSLTKTGTGAFETESNLTEHNSGLAGSG